MDCKQDDLLIEAVLRNDKTSIKRLLNTGANVNAANNRKTALMFAAGNGNDAIVNILLMNNADIAAIDSRGFNALMFAIESGYITTVNILLTAGADVFALRNDGGSALLIAVENRQNHIIPVLVKCGLNINEVNGGLTLLMRSICFDLSQTTIVLVNCGADVNKATDYDERTGYTALVRAIDLDNEATVEMLLKNGANVNAVALDGWTPLMSATRPDCLETIKLLASYGANIKLKNSKGDTAVMIAERLPNQKVITLFRELFDCWSTVDPATIFITLDCTPTHNNQLTR